MKIGIPFGIVAVVNVLMMGVKCLFLHKRKKRDNFIYQIFFHWPINPKVIISIISIVALSLVLSNI